MASSLKPPSPQPPGSAAAQRQEGPAGAGHDRSAAWPTLQAIVDAEVCQHAGLDPAAYAAQLLDGGARLLQLRAKRLPSADFLRLCDTVVALASRFDAAVIVNDRVDLAAMSNAAGVHVGQDDLPVAEARRQLGGGAIVGCSTHTPEQITAALRTEATYVAVGPIFGTSTKDTGYAAVGVDLLRFARRGADRPVVAIGGITLENAARALEAGADMVAVISDLLVGSDPAARVRTYLQRLAR